MTHNSEALERVYRAAALERQASEYVQRAKRTDDPALKRELLHDAMAAQMRRFELLGEHD